MGAVSGQKAAAKNLYKWRSASTDKDQRGIGERIMVEALWSLEFNWGKKVYEAGVIIFEAGRLFGGDSSYYFLGKYEIADNDVLRAEVEIIHYAGRFFPIFGENNKHKVILEGHTNFPVMDLMCYSVDDPNQTIHVRCTRRTDLP